VAVTLNLKASPDKYYGAWVRKGRPVFMRSEAYEILAASLRLYLRRETSGLSFLIAGHRGAGKTALVTEVVSAISDELFERWDKWADERRGKPPPGPEPPAERQRPILVKLHGPSLVAKELPSPGGGEERKAKTGADGKGVPARVVRRWASGSVIEVNVNTAASEDAGKADADTRTAPTGRAQAALVQIMIALYRALSNEVGEAAAARALDRSDSRRELHEFAAQLRFDLDRAAGPETLRDIWEEIEPNQCGFLWSAKISEAFADSLVPDQHFREIVAVATAAQAFQVCSGAVTYNQTRKDSTTQERSSEFKTGFDAKDAMIRLAALGVGGLLGYGLAGTAGASVGLLGSLGVTSFSRRSSKRERAEDYTFIVDRSVQTLERDLPLVIERIRAAGLAPVFVVDELDKLPETGEDSVADSIRELINRLKHLTTDYGFFCFLTGRDYFNDLAQALAEKAYPVEHTYFSERLLIGYGPSDFNDYALQIIVPTGGEPQDFLDRYTQVKELILASHLNTIDFRRQLRRLEINHGSQTEGLPPQVSGSNAQLLAVSLQLAIDFVLKRARETKQVASGPDFWQMAFDVLYRIVRLWERDADVVDLGRLAIARDLIQRRSGNELATVNSEAVAADEIGSADFDALCNLAEELARHLCQFRAVFSQISDAAPPQAPDAINQMIFESLKSRNIVGLLRRIGETTSYEYLFRRDGVDRFSSQKIGELLSRLDASRASLAALDEIGVALGDLQSLGWSSTVSAATLNAAIDRSSVTLDLRDLPAAQSAAAPLAEFLQSLSNSQTPIGNIAGLCADVFREARLAAPLRLSEVVKTLPRHVPVPFQTLAASRLAVAIKGSDSDEIVDAPHFPADESKPDRDHWPVIILGRARAPPVATFESRAEAAWSFWLAAIDHFIREGSPRSQDPRPQFNDLVLNAGGRLPSRVLRYDLSEVDNFDWTELTLAAVASGWPRPGRSERAEFAPTWVALAGLRRLRFGRNSLETLIANLPRTGSEEKTGELTSAHIASFLPERDANPGTLVVATRPLTDLPSGPYLLVTAATLERYIPELSWLGQIRIIQAGAYERE
jgi:hypothetical protein